MAENLKGFEMSSVSGSPLSGLVVQLYAASDVQPNVGTVLQTTATDLNGMWQFTGLVDGAYDVKVTAPGINQVKWYKGNVKVGVAELRAITNDVSRAGRNKIINGRFQVNERLQVVTTGDNQFVIDRWKILTEAVNAAAFARDTADFPVGANYSGRLTVGAGSGNKFGLWQALDSREIGDLKALGGSLQVALKAATAQMSHIKAAIVGWTGTADATTVDPINVWGIAGTNPTFTGSWGFVTTPVDLAVTTSWVVYKIAEAQAISSSYNNLAVMIWSDTKTTTVTADIIRIGDVQLEPGPVCTLIEQRPYPTELGLCSAYHCEIGAAADIYFATNAAGASQSYGVRINFAVPMRAIPAVSVIGTWSVTNFGQPGAFGVGRSGLTLIWGSLASGIAFSSSTASTYLSADAEI